MINKLRWCGQFDPNKVILWKGRKIFREGFIFWVERSMEERRARQDFLAEIILAQSAHKSVRLSGYIIEKFPAWRVNSTLNFTRKTDIPRIAKRLYILWAAPVRKQRKPRLSKSKSMCVPLHLSMSGFLKFSNIVLISIRDLANIRRFL